MGCASSPKTRQEPDYGLIAEAWKTIQKQYVNRATVEPTELTYGAIDGMVNSLGDTGHSTFLNPEMVQQMRELQRGELKGIGIEIQNRDGDVVIVTPLDGSPAQKAGLRPGEIIRKIGGDEIAEWPLSRVVQRISGRPGTKVTLTIEDPRSSRVRQVTVTRASIKLREVTWQRLPGSCAVHVRLSSFDRGATRELRKVLEQIHQGDSCGIVLDLRNNPGGLLGEAIGVASQFLRNGTVLIVKNAQGETGRIPVEDGGLAPETPLVVLINEGSASAAEIVAAALRDNRRVPLVGQTTFGTGTVLQEFRLSDGSALLLAVEEWLTPSGQSFWHKGIPPEFPVALPREATPLFPTTERQLTAEQLATTSDQQLLTALRLLANQNELRVSGKP
jgi:carboxyl-terminal processing protease